MNTKKAKRLEGSVKGRSFKGFLIQKLIDNGKSAAVFKAEKDGQFYAIKLFDYDVVGQYGDEVQIQRINQEIFLRGHPIEHLVDILDGGSEMLDGEHYYYIIMEYVEGVNLREYIRTNECGQEFAIRLLKVLHVTTEELLIKYGLAHRDIKPENIMVRKDGKVIVMDLGVLKLVGVESLTDRMEKNFIGTLRYAPPEFLLRMEKDTILGWRGVNYYQIGAVLHDVIMKKPLFSDQDPYTRLVIAIKDEVPKIESEDFSYEFLRLVRDMLTKDWLIRLNLLTTNRIKSITDGQDVVMADADLEFDELNKFKLTHKAWKEALDDLERSELDAERKKREISQQLCEMLISCLEIIHDRKNFSEMTESEGFHFPEDGDIEGMEIQNLLFELKGSLDMGFPRNLFLLIRIANDENYYCVIQGWGIFPAARRKASVRNPLSVFDRSHKRIRMIDLFKGVVQIDEDLRDDVLAKLIRLFHKALQAVKPEVESAFKSRAQRIKSKKPWHNKITEAKDVIIDKL